MRYKEQVEIAIAAFSNLEDKHKEFAKIVAGLSSREVDGGSIGLADGDLVAECLGVEMRTVHRPILKDGCLGAIEYAFVATHIGQDVDVWVMYLQPDDNLSSDSGGKEQICQMNNSYLTKQIIERLVSALLSSKMFVAKK